jgi:hypothetical protein
VPNSRYLREPTARLPVSECYCFPKSVRVPLAGHWQRPGKAKANWTWASIPVQSGQGTDEVRAAHDGINLRHSQQSGDVFHGVDQSRMAAANSNACNSLYLATRSTIINAA